MIDKPVGEGEVGAGAHRDCIALLALARDLAGEGRALDVFIGKLGVDLVLAGRCGKTERSGLVVSQQKFSELPASLRAQSEWPGALLVAVSEG